MNLKRAFTLFELIFVIVILGIIASITLKLTTSTSQIKVKKIKTQIAQIRAGLTAYSNKQILAAKNDIYPLYLEKNINTRNEVGAVLFDEIIQNSDIKSNGKGYNAAKTKEGWYVGDDETGYLINLNAQILQLSYCQPGSTKDICKDKIGQIICTSQICNLIDEEN